MPDRVTNIEIEDVLSSIRRLVSSEDRVPRGKKASADKDLGESQKLLLTPAQRIDRQEKTLVLRSPVSSDGGETSQNNVRDLETDQLESADIQERPDEAGADLSAQEFRSARHLESRIAEFEEVVARQSDEWEPDGTEEDAYSSNLISTLSWAHGVADAVDHVEIVDETEEAPEKTSARLRGQKTDSSAEADEFNWVIEDSKIDESALRDLVTEIVHNELQGALGERITRNVRKLVRREIQRALLAHKLD